VYGRGTRVPFREEDDLLLGATTKRRWSYACSKATDECLGLALARDHGLPVVVARFFNTVGPRQTGRHGMVLPTFVDQALAGEPLTVHGSGAQTRSFCHVRDTVEALVRLARRPVPRGGLVVNVGNDQELSILSLAERVRAYTGSDAPIVRLPYSAVHGEDFEDVERRVPALERLVAHIGWRPSISLERILADVVASRRAERARAASAAPTAARAVLGG
jgi:UDP-glucose 4-epimerase